MHVAIIGISSLAAAIGMLAAVLWFVSARIKIPSAISVEGHVNEGQPDLTINGVSEMADALKQQSDWSKWAALATGASVLLQALAQSLQFSN